MKSRVGWKALLVVVALTGAPIVAEGQSSPSVRSLVPMGRRESVRETVPESHLPPPGMCRIWIDNVPPAQQPAPTDCASAIKNRPSNGRVIFPEDGPRVRKDEKERDATPGRGGRAKDSKPRKP